MQTLDRLRDLRSLEYILRGFNEVCMVPTKEVGWIIIDLETMEEEVILFGDFSPWPKQQENQ